MAVRLADLVRGRGPLSERQLAQVKKWVEDDWESHDVDREAVQLIGRLLDTLESRRSPSARRPKPTPARR